MRLDALLDEFAAGADALDGVGVQLDLLAAAGDGFYVLNAEVLSRK